MGRAGAVSLGLALAAGCTPADPEVPVPPAYGPVTASFLTDGLLSVVAEMNPEATVEEMRAYTDCAAAEAMALRGARFARHVRTLTSLEAGIRRADTVYTVATVRPDGLEVLDAEETRAACAAEGIPGV